MKSKLKNFFLSIFGTQLAKWFGIELYAKIISMEDTKYFTGIAVGRFVEIWPKAVTLNYVVDGQDIISSTIISRISIIDAKKLAVGNWIRIKYHPKYIQCIYASEFKYIGREE